MSKLHVNPKTLKNRPGPGAEDPTRFPSHRTFRKPDHSPDPERGHGVEPVVAVGQESVGKSRQALPPGLLDRQQMVGLPRNAVALPDFLPTKDRRWNTRTA